VYDQNVAAQLVLNIDFALLVVGTPQRNPFEVDFRADVATLVGSSVDQVSVTQVTGGSSMVRIGRRLGEDGGQSTVVLFIVRTSDGAAMRSALQGAFAYSGVPIAGTETIEPASGVMEAIPMEVRVVGVIFSSEEILAAMQSRGNDGVDVLAVAVRQEVLIPLRELPGAPSDYEDDPTCTPCQVKRYQLKRGAADVASVDVADVQLLSISRRRRRALASTLAGDTTGACLYTPTRAPVCPLCFGSHPA
jgi:hypothetical protein